MVVTVWTIGHSTHPIERFLDLLRKHDIAIMCAEAVFFRCHRRYVSNALVAAGHGVVHIYPDGRTQVHTRKGDLAAYR